MLLDMCAHTRVTHSGLSGMPRGFAFGFMPKSFRDFYEDTSSKKTDSTAKALTRPAIIMALRECSQTLNTARDVVRTPRAAAAVILWTTAGLYHLMRYGVAHGQISPSNILVEPRGKADGNYARAILTGFENASIVASNSTRGNGMNKGSA